MATNHVTSGPNFTSLVILKKKLACCKCRNDKSILDKKKLSFACFTTLDGVAASARLHLSYVETLQLISLEVAFCLLFGHKSGTQIQYKNKE